MQRQSTISEKRKVHPPEFKAKVSFEANKGLKTTSKLPNQFKVHPVQISSWKKQAIESLPETLKQGKRAKQPLTERQLTATLYEETGRLKMELDWLKKVGSIRWIVSAC